MELNAKQLQELGAKVARALGDAVDGTKDGEFNPAEVGLRVKAEVDRLRTLPDRVARRPLEYVLGGVIVGLVGGVLLGVALSKLL